VYLFGCNSINYLNKQVLKYLVLFFPTYSFEKDLQPLWYLGQNRDMNGASVIFKTECFWQQLASQMHEIVGSRKLIRVIALGTGKICK